MTARVVGFIILLATSGFSVKNSGSLLSCGALPGAPVIAGLAASARGGSRPRKRRAKRAEP